MPKVRLTAVAVERLNPPKSGRSEVRDIVVPGLCLRVTEKGAKSWSLLYRVAGEGGLNVSGRQLRGKLKRMTLGQYPLMELSEARQKARDGLDLADRGYDPVEGRDVEIAAARREYETTVRSVAEEFLERHRKRNNTLETWKIARSVFERIILPAWGARPLASIKRRDIMALIDDVVDQHPPSTANRTFKEIRKLLHWAVEREIIDASPINGVGLPTVEHSRERVLTDQELCAVCLGTQQLGYPLGPYYQLLIFTAQRRIEVATLRWSDLDLKAAVWRMRPEVTKSRRGHEVPLVSSAVRILENMPRFDTGDFIFSTTYGVRPIGGFSKAKKRLDAAVLKLLQRDNERAEQLPPWRGHDLRRTAATNMARLGISIDVIGRVLNHSSGRGVTGIYDRYSYLPEKRQALELWAEKVESLSSRV